MRHRHRTIPSRVQGSMLTRRKISGIYSHLGLTEYHSADATLAIPLLDQRFIDAEKSWETHAINECYNSKVVHLVGGSPPDFGESDRERITPYTEFAESAGSYNRSVPTAYILSRAAKALPAIFSEPDWRSDLSQAGHLKWINEGWRAPKISLYSGFSLPNILLEWNQTKGLVKSWTDRDELLRRWHKFRGRHARLGGSLQQAANERLAHSYGTELLLADAKTLFETLVGLREKVDRFLKNCNKVQRLYKRRPNVVRLPLRTYKTPWSEFDSDPNGELRLYDDVLVTSRACLYYIATPPEFTQFWARVAQLSDSLGIRLDAGIVWDAIKYSFVIDWFINMSEWLHSNMAINNWQVDITYHTFCTSAKVEYVRSLRWYTGILHDTWPGIDFHEPELCRSTWTIYRRSLGEIPQIGKVKLELNGQPWKVRRAVNALALAAQKAHLPARKFSKSFFGYTD